MIFTLDGNIGCGKSTVLQHLHQHYHLSIDLEPVARWQPFLDDMYREGKGAFEFQTRVWLDRCWVQQRPNQANILMERSPFFQSQAFVTTNLENGRITMRQYQMLQEMYARAFQIWAPAGYVYLRSNPQQCAARVKMRGRDAEEAIPLAYLEQLHAHHERAYHIAASFGFPMICIDVEGKSVPHIAAEVWSALTMLGFVGEKLSMPVSPSCMAAINHYYVQNMPHAAQAHPTHV